MIQPSYHSICAWTFNAGKGGFTPSDTRPQWSQDRLDTCAMIDLIREKITPRLPDHIRLGLEIHYDYEYNEENAGAIAGKLIDSGIALAMTTPGAHRHFPYGGPASLDKKERDAVEAEDMMRKAVMQACDIFYHLYA